MTTLRPPRDFAALVRGFFCKRLIDPQNVSPHTVAAYRDTFRLRLAFVRKRRRRTQHELTLDDLDAPMVLAFLNDLEATRKNTARTRNARLCAIRAFVTYASACEPTALPITQRILAIPSKRFNRPLLGHLTQTEMESVLDAPDRSAWSGRRDRVLFTVMYNTGARVSEVIGLCREDLELGPAVAIRIHGKGRKDRSMPLWKRTAALLADWLSEIAVENKTPLFPNRHGRAMSRSGVEDRLQNAVNGASDRCPSLLEKNVSPHTLRHTSAMHLLQAGVDVTVIALWLGHESPETTHQYVEADVEMKRRVLDRVDEPNLGKALRPYVPKPTNSWISSMDFDELLPRQS
jgi:integrase/recombinase XerD